MVGWHHGLDEHDFEQTPGVGDGREARLLQLTGSQRVRNE